MVLEHDRAFLELLVSNRATGGRYLKVVLDQHTVMQYRDRGFFSYLAGVVQLGGREALTSGGAVLYTDAHCPSK